MKSQQMEMQVDTYTEIQIILLYFISYLTFYFSFDSFSTFFLFISLF